MKKVDERHLRLQDNIFITFSNDHSCMLKLNHFFYYLNNKLKHKQAILHLIIQHDVRSFSIIDSFIHRYHVRIRTAFLAL